MKQNNISVMSFLICLILIPCLSACSPSQSGESFDILIKNTKIVDGTGGALRRGSVAIKDERIVAVGRVTGEAETVIDGSGLVTCPGFIDPHTHADQGILLFPLATNFIWQGITTIIAGNCGFSPAPRKDLTFQDWMSKVEEKKIAVNLAQLVGHSDIRAEVMGSDWKREATPDELREMKAYVEESMKSGALGLSTGVDAPWTGFFASMDEK